MECDMAEGMLGGILGEEDQKPEIEASETFAGADAFAAAVAAKLAGSDPEVARDTSAFLKKQAQILETQNQHLKEEHEARLHYLRGQAREVDIRRFGLRLRVGFQLFIALVATVIGVGVAIMIDDAVTSRRVVIEPFHTPPTLVANGIDGSVVAAGLLDEISHLQAATRSTAEKRDLTNAWTNDVKLAVPETGVTIGEISRILRARFGHDLHLYGDLVTTVSGQTLTVRGDGLAPKAFTGAAADLTKLTTAAAEYVYAQSAPALWAYYLEGANRNQEAIAFCRAAYSNASDVDRPFLLNVWANAINTTGGDPREALKLYRAALKLKPNFWIGYNNVINSLWGLGDEEGAWRAGEELRKKAGGRPGAAPETEYQNWDDLTWNLQVWRDVMVGDLNSGGGTNTTAEGPQIAAIEVRMHDWAAAELALGTTNSDENDPTIVAISHFVRGRLAAEAGDVELAANEMEAFGSGYADPIVRFNYPGQDCWIAPAEEAAGRRNKADAAFKAGGTFVNCYRFRADILDSRGDWVGAQKAYEEAVALAPDLPAAYYSWGVALLRHGDHAGGEAKLRDANKRGPHWADPLKVLGDLLAKQGNAKDALAKYDEAIQYAPNWKELRAAREALTKHAG
jgi:tetratricopeptide (TPR) repeat protein